MAEHNELGKLGEDLAKDYLMKKGYRILETNWRKHRLEIDIIATNKKELILVEVKSRNTSYFGNPESFVDRKKQQMMAEAAELYLHELEEDGMEVRYDIVAIVIDNSKVDIQHYEDAFFPDNLGLGEIFF